MILVIDYYDSFTYNLVQYLLQMNIDVSILRNDEFTLKEIERLKPEAILLSPGPGNPESLIRDVEQLKICIEKIPTLGVCLGHQIIGHVFGGKIKKSGSPMHGKISMINHDGKGIFTNIPSPFKVVRYHSLVIEPETLPPCLEISATTTNGEIMAIRHKELSIESVQFHPESILTDFGFDLLRNFITFNTTIFKNII